MSENSNRKHTRGVIIIIQIYKLFEFLLNNLLLLSSYHDE